MNSKAAQDQDILFSINPHHESPPGSKQPSLGNRIGLATLDNSHVRKAR
jgi:hypothetical protein